MAMPEERKDEAPEAWRSAEAAKSRARFGWGVAVFVVALIVAPMVAKYFHWF